MGVYINTQVLFLVLFQIVLMSAGAGVCPRLKSKFCLDLAELGYDKTFFPNLMGHTDQKEAKEAMRPYEALAKTGCSRYIGAFICASFLPACPEWKDVPKKAQKPCRELCEKARAQCEDTLISDFGMEWPAELDCGSLPSDDPTRRNPVCTNYVPPRPAYCKKDQDVGRCQSYRGRYYYNYAEQKCKQFTYSGCMGNENRFLTEAECEEICGNETTTAPSMSSSPSVAAELSSTAAMTTTLMPTTEEKPTTTTMAPSTEYVSTKEPDGLPVIRSISANKVVLSGGSAELFCLASGTNEYTWKRIDGAYPHDKIDTEESSRLAGSVLRMVELAPEDAGIYACVATNANGYVEALVTLTVVVAPTIRTIDTPQLVSEGGRLEIDCMGEGVPQPTVIWERKDGGRVRTKGTDDRQTLIIKRADYSNAGTYFCIAVNQAGHANYTVEVAFESPVEIVDEIRPQFIMENETAFFVCTATGYPAPVFTWKKLDGTFPDDDRVVIEGPTVNNSLDYVSYSSILGIEPALVEDTGMYQCYATNSAGNYTAVGELLVRGPPRISQKPEPEQSVSVGDFAYFTCVNTGEPPYDVIWTKEGEPDWPGDDIRVVMEEDNMFLRIADVVPEDSGVYTCSVNSELGTDSAQSYLQVEDNFSDTLAIVIGPRDTTVPIGDTVQFKCRVTGSPFPTVKWTFNGIGIDPNGLFDGRIEQHGTNLVIREVELRDTGDYNCIASSIHGRAMDSAVLTVFDRVNALPSTAVVEATETDALTGTLFGETGGTLELDSTMATELEFVTQLPTDATTELLETLGTDELTTAGKSVKLEGSPTPTGARPAVKTSAPPEEKPGLLERRTDITNPGVRGLFSGWVDVQGLGTTNDFCRIIKDGDDYVLACSLAGTEGEEEFNYISSAPFDIGEEDTFYMKDENGDGRFDYCRCAAVEGKRYVWCTAAGENGFYGNEDAEPDTNQYSFKAEGDKGELKRCRRRFVDPFFGVPY